MNEATNSGRVCPLDYQYKPEDLAGAAVSTVETLYVIDGLYGNPFALQEVQKLTTSEKTTAFIMATSTGLM